MIKYASRTSLLSRAAVGAIADELSEQVYGGYAGLVVVDSLNSRFDLRDVTGLSSGGTSRALAVQFIPGPLAPTGPLAVVGRARELRLGAASSIAAYSGAGARRDAAATSLFGLGKSVSFGFDLTQATPALQSQLTLSRAVSLATPPPRGPDALAVTGVRVRVASTTASVNATVIETLSPPLYALDTLPAATVTNLRRRLEWQVPLSAGQSVPLLYWARLPDAAGTWSVTTEVRTAAAPVTLSSLVTVT